MKKQTFSDLKPPLTQINFVASKLKFGLLIHCPDCKSAEVLWQEKIPTIIWNNDFNVNDARRDVMLIPFWKSAVFPQCSKIYHRKWENPDY